MEDPFNMMFLSIFNQLIHRVQKVVLDLSSIHNKSSVICQLNEGSARGQLYLARVQGETLVLVLECTI